MSHQSSLPEPEVFQNRAVPEPEVFQNRAVPEPEVFHIYGKVLSSSYCQRLIARYLPQTTLIEDPSYSVYLRFDFTSGDIGDVTGELGSGVQ
jgi:hypothetical protein